MAQDPLWDEEVVPALRKRLQSESKTLARRLSAISLPSGDEARSSPGPQVLNPQKHHSAQVQVQQHPSKAKTPTQTLRQRTYSSPKNPHPTRIPKARQMSGGSSSGSAYNRQPPSRSQGNTPKSQDNTPKPRQMPPSSSSESRSTFDLPKSHTRGLGLLHESPPFPIDSMSSSSSAGGGLYADTRAHGQRYGLGLGLPHTQAHMDVQSQAEEDPPRPSIDSEERPYEHWYRGEVSRNGGVGELKVGRRQEMLDIANYGHFILSRKAGANGVAKNGVSGGAGGRENGYLDLLKIRRRHRAGSIGGLTRKERDSLYLDEVDEDVDIGADAFGGWRGVEASGYWGERVLDQDPPTDFDKDDDEDDEDDEEEEAEEEGVEEVDEDEERTAPTRHEDESHTQYNATHNLTHNYQEEHEEDNDFVFINHPHQTTSDTPPYPYAYAYIPTEADVLNTPDSMSPNTNVNINGTADLNTGERWTPTAGAHQTQKSGAYPTNPTIPPNATPTPRPSSRQTQTSPPPSRIPHPSSSSRRSSDSRSTHNGTSTPTPTTVPRATTPTSILPRPTRTKSEPPSSSTPQGVPPPSSFTNRSTSPGSTSTSSSPSPSQSTPTPKKSPKNTNSQTKTNSKPKAKPKSKSKPPPTKRQEKSDKRSSVAMYPTVEGGEELADAIPSWTQPITLEGNWDDVVLPVVARKKGLEGYYETNPHLQLQKRLANGLAQEIVAPAPGTFGFDHSKYRPLRIGEDAGGDEFVELDEFGVSKAPPPVETEEEDAFPKQERTAYAVPNSKPNPTANPMMQVQGQMHISKKHDEKGNDKDLDESAGCCKCIVM